MTIICTNCGSQLDDNARFCSTCGVQFGQQAGYQQPYGQSGQPQYQQPYGQPGQPQYQQPYGQPGQPQYQQSYTAPAVKKQIPRWTFAAAGAAVVVVVLIATGVFGLASRQEDPPAKAPASVDTPEDEPSVNENNDAGKGNNNDSETDTQDDMVDLWARLDGYWTTTDNAFIGFFLIEGAHTFEYGLFYSEFWRTGVMTDYVYTDENEVRLTILLSATEASGGGDAAPEEEITITLDYSGLNRGGTIDVTGSGGLFTYAYGGKTIDEAYDSL